MNHPFLYPAAVVSALAALAAAPAPALPLLSEVLYDATGSDDGLGFVELFGDPGSSVEGFAIEGVNGADGSTTVTIPLIGTFPEDGVLVVADTGAGGMTSVPDADLLANFDFQNGPDSIVLLDDMGVVIDAVGYGSFDPEHFFAGEGCPVLDAPAGSSIARVFADVDTDDNLADWDLYEVPTPGSVDLQAVPEPTSALLFAVGVAGLAVVGRRRLPTAGSGPPRGARR